jgi:hypothetical protein
VKKKKPQDNKGWLAPDDGAPLPAARGFFTVPTAEATRRLEDILAREDAKLRGAEIPMGWADGTADAGTYNGIERSAFPAWRPTERQREIASMSSPNVGRGMSEGYARWVRQREEQARAREQQQVDQRRILYPPNVDQRVLLDQIASMMRDLQTTLREDMRRSAADTGDLIAVIMPELATISDTLTRLRLELLAPLQPSQPGQQSRPPKRRRRVYGGDDD